jgi:hypothetical protein
VIWRRSWPADPYEGVRAYVMDSDSSGIERLYIRLHDLDTASDLPAVSFILIEWDLAVGREDMRLFERLCARQPERVQVAPYRLYPKSTGLDRTVWAHRTGMEPHTDWISEREPEADAAGFGLIYLPAAVVRRFQAEVPRDPNYCRFTDTTFSLWHQRAGLGRIPVHWEVQPVHLHW